MFSRIAAGQSIIFDQRATHCMGLSRKQYYTACHKLKRAGIITKKDGDYRLSSFGKLVLLTQNIIARALACKPGLDTLDVVVQSGAQAMPYDQLIDMLVQDATIKRMLLTPQTKAESEAVTSASMFNE